jgi:murein DD-endopeptidase MepM/ murein hydrolase activator NlpD
MNNPFTIMAQANREKFHPVVEFDPARDRLKKFDFTEANPLLTAELLGDTIRFMDHINQELEQAGARYGIGGYDEHRTIYSRSGLFGQKTEEEPRRLHLGIDIWGKPYSKVMAPLDGIVHSFGFNNGFGDYGTTIILVHQLDGIIFHTLYGHLSLSSISNMSEGDRIGAGDVLAGFGIPAENGSWPPHLHFQVILDMKGLKGDYPGVCRFSEREQYLANSPDPDLILKMMKYAS